MRCISSWLGFLVLAFAGTASAVPIVVDPSAGAFSVFDQGGILNHSAGGFYMGGLEVSPTGAVYVTQANAGPGGGSSQNRLVRSTGLGSASQVGPTYGLGNNGTRGNDLTLGPGGLYYVAVNGGVYGLDPTGVAAPSLYASGGTIASSGVTFLGGQVFVSSDSPGRLATAGAGGTLSTFAAIGGNDDHVTTASGTHYLIGDSSRIIRDALGTSVFNLASDPDTAPLLGQQGNGSRGAIDPVTGDIFVGYSFGGSNQAIFRVRADFSDAILFATTFGRNIRDFDFGPSSSGLAGSTSLYVSVNDLNTGVGTIYETVVSVVPEPTTGLLLMIGLAGLSYRKERAC